METAEKPGVDSRDEGKFQKLFLSHKINSDKSAEVNSKQ